MDDVPDIIRTCIFDNPDDSSPPCAEAICAKEIENSKVRTKIPLRMSYPRCFAYLMFVKPKDSY